MQLYQCFVGGGEILSSEGTTQGDLADIGTYALGILPLIKFLLEFTNLNKMNTKEVVLADDFSVAGSLNSIRLLGQINSNWPKIRLIP